jgi:hypothetical protein
MMKYLKITAVVAFQLAIVIYLSLLAQKGLEVIPVPDVFKNMSLIELDDLDRSILQSAVDLKSKFVSNEAAVDSNIVIVNIETINPVPRGEIAKAIKFLKDNGAKTIALNIFIDEPRDDIDPSWDSDLAEAIEYKNRNVIGINGFQYTNENFILDTLLSLQPIEKFNKLGKVGFGNLEMTPENEGSIVQQFFPNAVFKGKPLESFPLAVAEHYDSARAVTLKGKFDKEYVNFYKKDFFKIWNMSYIINPILSESFAPLVKGKLFIIGFINPETDALRFNMYSTPMGKLEYSLVYAGIISDILTHKFVPESPFLVDMMLGALFCLFNILLYMTAMRKTIGWERFTGAILIPLEIVVIYVLVIFVFVFFNYKLSVIIPSIVIMVSIPFNSFTNKKIVPFLLKQISWFKFSKVPYPLHQQLLNIFEPEKRSIRYMTSLFSFQRVFWILCALSCAVKKEKNNKSEIIDNSELQSFKAWDNLKNCNSNRKTEINEIISRILEKNSVSFKELQTVSFDYYNLFTHNSLKREIYIRLEADKDIDPGKDKFGKLLFLFRDFFTGFEKEFHDYKFIYVTKKSNNKYLILDISEKHHKAAYLQTNIELKHHAVYLHKINSDEFILLEPYLYFIQCKYHLKKELFVFSNKQFDEYTGKERSHYVGEYFMCSPTDPPKTENNKS